MTNPITQLDLSQITKNRYFLPITIAISALIAGIIAITIIIAVVKHKQKLKNNPKQIPPANLSGKTNDARDGQSTENSISDDENNKMPKSPLNVEANSQPNDRFANMRADEETMKRIIEESEQTATAQNPNTNQPAAQENDEKIERINLIINE